MRHRKALVIAAVLVLTSRASADPVAPLEVPLHFKTPSLVQTDGGSKLRLPPGYFLDEPLWKRQDDEVKRLQEQETRLAAENKSLRSSAKEISFGWYALSAAVVAGFSAGYLLGK